MVEYTRQFMRTLLKNMKLPQINFQSENEKWAWLAALIDGEGCLGLYRQYKYKIVWGTTTDNIRTFSRQRNGHTYYSRLVIANTSPDLILLLQTLFGGSITIRENKIRFCFNWILPESLLQSILRNVLPYLIVKRKQAELIIEALELKKENRNSHRLKNLADRIKEATDNRGRYN